MTPSATNLLRLLVAGAVLSVDAGAYYGGEGWTATDPRPEGR